MAAVAAKHHITQSSTSSALTVAATAEADTPAATREKATPRSVPSLKVRRSVSENLIDFSDSRKRDTVYENLSGRSPWPLSVVDRRRLVRQLTTGGVGGDGDGASDVLFPVNEWMMSLLAQAEDYDDDIVTYHVKSIPSATFNDIGANYGNGGIYGGKGDCTGDISYRVEEFRQNVINNQKRKEAIEVKAGSFDPVVISFCDSEFESSSERSKGKCGN